MENIVMKRIFDNKYTDHVVKFALTAILGFILYTLIDMRDFQQYIQPAKDKEQDAYINNVRQYCQQEVDAQRERNGNVNKRLDGIDDKARKTDVDITEIKIYQQLILKKLNIITQEQAINNKNQ
jgi:hypothetical protein